MTVLVEAKEEDLDKAGELLFEDETRQKAEGTGVLQILLVELGLGLIIVAAEGCLATVAVVSRQGVVEVQMLIAGEVSRSHHSGSMSCRL